MNLQGNGLPENRWGYENGRSTSGKAGREDSQHGDIRNLLRVVGPAVVLIGVVFSVIGIGNFFYSFGSFQPPRYFWCAFVGFPLLGIGSGVCKFAFMGAVSRYIADEVAPVGKDVVNYMADGTQDAVRTIAAAVSDGLRDGVSTERSQTIHCRKCNADNDPEANFCKACGGPLAKSTPCRACGEMNDADARFCARCGKPVG